MKFVLIWLVCGLYAWGTLMAELDYKNRHQWAILNEHSRDNCGICAAVTTVGPVGAVAVAIVTNFNQHGWELWEHQQ